MAQAAASTCEICTGGPGEYYCQQCDQLFCGSCKLSHLRTKPCKNHTFLSGPNINKEEKLLCTEHEEIFFFYCQDCDTPVCRIGSVEKHSRHLMTDLTKATEKLRSELVKTIESKITTSSQTVSQIERETNAYREEVKAVIKNITDDGKYIKNLIDKKVDSCVKLVQDEEHKALQNMSALTKLYKGIFENCQRWQKNITEMETIADVLLLRTLKQLKIDVDTIDLKQVPEMSSVSYRKKNPSGTDIDNLFGELQFREGKALLENTKSQQNTRPKEQKESHKKYKYACFSCRELEITVTTDTRRTAAYLDLFLNIDVDGRLYTKIYNKRDDFNFPIINFPFLSSNILPSAPSYGIYISQLIRYSRACSHNKDFIYRSVLLTQKLLQQSYEEDRLKLTLHKFYGHHHELVDAYDVTLTKLAKDIFTTW